MKKLLQIYFLAFFPGFYAEAQESSDVLHQIDIKADSSRLVVLDQLGSDLVIETDGLEENLRLDSPAGWTGPEFLLLGPYSRDYDVTLRLTAKYPDQQPEYSISVEEIDPQSPDINYFRALTEASQQVYQGTVESIARAKSIYQQLMSDRIDTAHLGHIEGYAPLFLASLHFQTFDLQEAQEIMSVLRGSPCLLDRHCYMVDLLALRIDSSQSSDPEMRGKMETLLADIESMPGNENFDSDIGLLKALLGYEYIYDNNERALSLFLESQQIARSTGNNALLGEAHNGLATYYHHIDNDLFRVVEHLELATENIRKSGEERNLAYVSANLSHTYRDMGDFGQAQDTLHNVLAIVESSQDKSLPREIYHQLGNLYILMGDYNRAEQYANLVIASDIESQRIGKLNEAYNLLGRALREKGDYGKAIEWHTSSADYFQSVNHERNTSILYNELARDYLESGNAELARLYFDRAYDIPVFGDQLKNSADGLKHQAMLYLTENRPAEALNLLGRSETTTSYAVNSTATAIDIAYLKMKASAALDDLDNVIAYGDEAVSLINDIQGQLEYYRLGPAWSAKTNEVYKDYADILLQEFFSGGDQEMAEKAFLVTESSRAVNLVRQRNASGQLQQNDEASGLRRALTQVSRQRASSEIDDPAFNEISQQYFRTLEQYQALQNPDFPGSSGMSDTSDISLTAIFEAMPENSAAIEYLCVPSSACYSFVLDSSNQTLDARRLADYDEIAILSSAAITEFESINASNTPGTDLLSEKLIAASIAGLPGDISELLVITDNPLHSIPIAALSLPGAVQQKQHLIDRYSLTNVPALYSYQQDSEDTPYVSDLAILADPLFSNASMPNLIASTDTFRGWVNQLTPLPWSAREAENIRTIFAGKQVNVFTGEQANRNNLIRPEVRNAEIVHIASHAFFNEKMPDLVGIALSSEPGDLSNPEGDFVTLNELLNMEFSSRLVVISGCETGQGEYLDGEGNMSMARGFLANGVQNVISTLWPVSDRASAEFMNLFYKALYEDDLSIRQALQKAQQALSGHPRYSAPYYWAGYTLSSV